MRPGIEKLGRSGFAIHPTVAAPGRPAETESVIGGDEGWPYLFSRFSPAPFGCNLPAGTFTSTWIMHRRSTEGSTVRCRSFTARRRRPSIALSIVKGVIDVAVEAIGPVKPRSRTDENAARKPLGPVIAVRSAVVRRRLIVTVGADRRSAGHARGNTNPATRRQYRKPYRHRKPYREGTQSFE
jgi:hypothetical protein